MDMGSQGSGRRRPPTRERLTAEDDALNQIAREAEARLAAKRAARAEAREIRMKELERQQKEIYQVQKKYYGLDTKWGDIEQWMEDSERYSRRSRRNTSASDEDERMSVGSRGSLRTNGYDGDLYGSQSLGRRSGRNSSYSGEGRFSALSSSREETLGLCGSDLGPPGGGLAPKPLSVRTGSRPSYLYSAARPAGSYRASVFDDGGLGLGGARRGSACGSYAPSEHGGHLNSSSRASSRASSARASPVVEERPEKDFTEKGSRSLPGLSAATLASLGGTSSRRGSGDTSISVDTEASIREIKELSELKDQIQDVEGKYMQGLKEMKDSLAEVEEKYKKAMVSNAQLDNEKTNFMYQVDTLKDMLLELEEQLAESRRQYEDKSKEFEREKHAHSILQFQFAEVKEALKQREEMLEEIRQLQQKQASYIREISDLQETIEWKDKKIGALERQKEFFDSIRSDRDDLREEVVMLKEELKKHGIVLNSDIATNGETSETLNNVGHQGPSKITKEELNALKTTGDGTLGRASEVEVKSEIVENVGKREILQNSEQEQHREDPAQECVDTEVLHPGENAEDQKASEDSAPSLGVLADATNEEQAQNQILENASFLENTAQVESNEVTGTPDDRTGAPLEQSECLSELVDEIPGPGSGQDSCNASDIKKQSKESAEKQEDLKTSLGEDSTKPCQESAPLQTSEVGGLDSADPGEQGGSPTEGVVEAGLMGLGEQVGTGASGPPTYNNDNMSHDEECAAEAHTELDTSTGHALDKELSRQEAAEPPELPGQRAAVDEENDEKEDEERGLRDEEPGQTEVQDVPCCPAAESSPQGATGLAVPDAKSKPLVTKEPEEEKSDQKGDALASSQKKIKNKKKKNKKKSPAPVETLQDAKKELTFQNSDGSEVKEGEHAALSDTKPVVKTQNEVPESPKEKNISGSSEKIDCPENLKIELAEKLDQEDNDVNTKKGGKTADGDTLGLRGDTTQSSDMSASDKELDEAVRKDDAKEDGAAHSSAPEPGHGGASSSALPENEGPFKDTDDAPQTGSTEQHETAEGPSQIVGKAVGNDHVASAGELGASNSEGRDKPRGGSEKGKSNEECTMS
ncbi:leucine-rich repeat flightless-interacting protein 1 isoform X2 [Canis lupus familiaris]|uniref:leucine-rich repeat flightless-interacting protein 1 isoform X2 n=1 Tax=Canis lupus familiaris TaxID=9615 RepID=UPI0018F2F21C|nr:leucine-rich repeat flightless-interacting protein 1 isoform X2 [Canis lupus familiaris]XP_038314439.1 leucine-rich repeat flightless-interacting protein 1 isoform X2 [Canis lupus familiaris]XP_038430226.1 leucine-rich repeat flightless-interacting protein 1 isoform X2 [Canis lupus familiaris]